MKNKSQGRNSLFWLRVSYVSVHCVEEGMMGVQCRRCAGRGCSRPGGTRERRQCSGNQDWVSPPLPTPPWPPCITPPAGESTLAVSLWAAFQIQPQQMFCLCFELGCCFLIIEFWELKKNMNVSRIRSAICKYFLCICNLSYSLITWIRNNNKNHFIYHVWNLAYASSHVSFNFTLKICSIFFLDSFLEYDLMGLDSG